MKIQETKDLKEIVKLAKSYDTPLHSLDTCIKAWVALDNKEIVGGVILRSKEGFYSLDLLDIKKEFQGKGIGRKLTNKVIKAAESLGAKKVFLYTRRARGFYEKLGFKEINEEDFPKPLLFCLGCKRKEVCAPVLMEVDVKKYLEKKST